MEEAQDCQPCGHSPGSRALHSGGLLPSHNSTQLGRRWNPCMSNRTEASRSSCKHPWRGSWDDSWSTTSVATAGLRSAIMGRASAHDAQKAAGAHLSAERKPSPPIRIGNVEMLCAFSSSSAGTWPSSLLAVSTFPRRGHDSRPTTDSVASSSLCGSRAGLHSAGGAATNTGDRVLWE